MVIPLSTSNTGITSQSFGFYSGTGQGASGGNLELVNSFIYARHVNGSSW